MPFGIFTTLVVLDIATAVLLTIAIWGQNRKIAMAVGTAVLVGLIQLTILVQVTFTLTIR